MRPVDVMKKGKKGQKLSCVKLAICPDHPRRHSPLKFCVSFLVLQIVIYFRFHKNWWRCLRAVRDLLLTWPMAYTTACERQRHIRQVTYRDFRGAGTTQARKDVQPIGCIGQTRRHGLASRANLQAVVHYNENLIVTKTHILSQTEWTYWLWLLKASVPHAYACDKYAVERRYTST